ncbi:MAG: glycosyltransferase family 4 protein [Planctomycetota bacterium]|nr:glycosyltransferase family 4 protein [Planctomycetota bacterium]
MKLLFLTQTLDADDAVLGFTTRWVAGLSKHVDEVRAVALEVGRTDELPENVSWREIGRRGKIGRWLRYRKVLNEAFAEGYDAVLAHIVPRYASLAATPARRAGAKLFLWYTHGAVDARLRKAESQVLKVFTATEESLRLETPKRVVTGHGVDLENFDPRGVSPDFPPRILAVGRISPAKDPLTLLAAVSILRSRGRELHLDLVGAGLLSADDSLRRQVEEQIEWGGLAECVNMPGAVGYSDIAAWYHRATVVVNSSATGSLDKVVIEAMAAERPVLSCNPSAAGVLSELGRDGDALIFEKGSAEDLAAKLEAVLDKSKSERLALGGRLRALAARDHEVDALMARLVAEMKA